MDTEFQLDEEQLQAAAQVIEEGLCKHCLGRLFGKVGSGFTNPQRSELIFAQLGKDVNDLPSPEECSVCQGLFAEMDDFLTLVEHSSKEYQYDTFLVGSKVDPEVSEAEEQLWSRFKLEKQEPIKSELNREIGKRLEPRLGKSVEFKSPHLTFVVDTRYNNIELTVKPLYVYGRYKKLERGIPQTKWFCRKCRGRGCDHCNNTGKMYETSVEELCGALFVTASKGESHSFHGMGREDIDALMLGNGRPFVLEVTEPRIRELDLKELEEQVNERNKGRIEVTGLVYSDLKTVRAIKASKSKKTYKVAIEFGISPDKEKLYKVANDFRKLQIHQQTPKRVSHRRADLLRKRVVHNFEILEFDDKKATVEITGESGLYIKELIHGDDGRTRPSLSSELGIECAVVTLDVTKVWDADEPNGSSGRGSTASHRDVERNRGTSSSVRQAAHDAEEEKE